MTILLHYIPSLQKEWKQHNSFASVNLEALPKGEQEILRLISVRLLAAVGEPYRFVETAVTPPNPILGVYLKDGYLYGSYAAVIIILNQILTFLLSFFCRLCYNTIELQKRRNTNDA